LRSKKPKPPQDKPVGFFKRYAKNLANILVQVDLLQRLAIIASQKKVADGKYQFIELDASEIPED
jgi:hypothetical protein